MSYSKGRLLDILNALYGWINTEMGNYYSNYYVTTEFDSSISNIDNLPWVSIRVEHDTTDEEIFGRIGSSTTDKVSRNVYTFTMHCHQKKGSGTHPHEPVLLVAQRIKDLLQRKNQHKTDIFSHGIDYITGMDTTVSRGRARNTHRAIIGGEIYVLRPDVTTSTSTTSTSTSTTSPP